MKRLLYRLLMGLFAVAVLAAIIYAFLPRPIEVDLAPVTRGPMQVWIEDDGKTRIRNRYTVSAPLNGKLLRTDLRAGSPIQAGVTVLAVIEPSLPDLKDERERAQAKARILQAKANLSLAKAELEHARREHERAKKGKISQEELERAALRERACEFTVQVREFELEIAEAVLKIGPDSIGDPESKPFKIVAPLNGVVLAVLQESERVVAAGTELLRYGDPEDLEAVIDVLSTDAVKIHCRMKVLLEYGGEKPLIGRVDYKEPGGFRKVSPLGVEEQRVNVVVSFTDTSPREQWLVLQDEYRVNARIILWEKEDTLRVPRGACFQAGKDHYVFLAENGKAKLRKIHVGKANPREFEVLDGLAETDQVILYPTDRIADGVAITPRNLGPIRNSPAAAH